MKKHKYILSLLALLSIVFILYFTGFSFSKFRYLSDGAILKNYLDASLLDSVRRDDWYGTRPKFYIIEENPTTDEIMRTLKLVVENDVNKTVVISKHQYFEGGGLIENVSVERLEPFEALKKYYTIKEATNDIVKGGEWEDGKPTEEYVDIPIGQAFAILSDDKYFVDIYARDSFLNKEGRYFAYKLISFYGSYSNYEEYHNKVLYNKNYAVNGLKRYIDEYIGSSDRNDLENYLKKIPQIVSKYYGTIR